MPETATGSSGTALETIHDDVRSLRLGAHDEFDLVLCLGILYHLDGLSAIELVHRTAELCRRVSVAETQVSLAPKASVRARGHAYWGRLVREFDPGTSATDQAALGRSAIGNPESLWLTRASLYNLLADAGYSSVIELPRPAGAAGRESLAQRVARARAVPGASEPDLAAR